MSLRGVLHLGLLGLRYCVEGRESGVAGELVVCVAAPLSHLMATEGAVAHGVLLVLLRGQAKSLSG